MLWRLMFIEFHVPFKSKLIFYMPQEMLSRYLMLFVNHIIILAKDPLKGLVSFLRYYAHHNDSPKIMCYTPLPAHIVLAFDINACDTQDSHYHIWYSLAWYAYTKCLFEWFGAENEKKNLCSRNEECKLNQKRDT